MILTHFANERMRYNELMANKSELDAALAKGAEKAKTVAQEVLDRVRVKIGY